MKNMKKAIALLLSAAMVLSMAGCAKKSPRDLYAEAVKKNSELSGMDMTTDMDMTMKVNDQSMDMTMKMDIKMADINTDKMKYQAEAATTVMGQEIPMNIVYTDGYYYMEMMGQKIKYPMDLDKMMEQIRQTTEASNMELDYMKEITAEKDGDNTILTFTADPSKMDSYVKDTMSGMGNVMGDMEDSKITIHSADGSITVNKQGYYTNMKMNIDMEVTAQDQTMGMVMKMDANINQPGQAVEVVLPELDGYTEVDPATMGM